MFGKHRGAVNNNEGTLSIYHKQRGKLYLYQLVCSSRGSVRQEMVASSQVGTLEAQEVRCLSQVYTC